MVVPEELGWGITCSGFVAIQACQNPIDNNVIENVIRPIALGRKNWMFAGSEQACKRAAAIMNLLATAKANGMDPHAWLTGTLPRLPTALDRDIDSLLPLGQE